LPVISGEESISAYEVRSMVAWHAVNLDYRLLQDQDMGTVLARSEISEDLRGSVGQSGHPMEG